MKPVNPGDPLLPALTAKWYNGTLEVIQNKGRKPKKKVPPDPGQFYCRVADDANPSDGPYTVIYISDIISDGTEVGPPLLEVNNLTPGIEEETIFGIAQEPVVPGGTILCCFSGITKANIFYTVTTSGDGYGMVADLSEGQFKGTRHEGWKRIGYDGKYEIIFLSTIQECNRVRGNLGVELTGSTSQEATLTNLIGINSPSYFLPDPLTVHNPHGFEADEGALARAEWVFGTKKWEIYQVTCPV